MRIQAARPNFGLTAYKELGTPYSAIDFSRK